MTMHASKLLAICRSLSTILGSNLEQWFNCMQHCNMHPLHIYIYIYIRMYADGITLLHLGVVEHSVRRASGCSFAILQSPRPFG